MQEKRVDQGIRMVYPGDVRVCALLGKQPKPPEGTTLRRSRFVYILYVGGRYLLFNTLTRQILLLPVSMIGWFMEGKTFPDSILTDGDLEKLYEQRFLVPEDEPEDRTYLELKDLLVLKEELPRGITHYVILPTSTCNARCFYCFEQGMRYRKMSAKTVEDTLRFILEHRPQDKKKIHIHWFGGEPMCAAENIDRICEGLTEAGIEFSAEMTSNGSLFTDESARKAAEKWKVGKIQITLDGMAEEYARRKRYTKALKEPFETVIGNIHRLIAAGISVTVRLNVDEDNLNEIYRVVDFLKETFTAEEHGRMLVYAHSLFGKPGEGMDACPAGDGRDELEARVSEINDYIAGRGLKRRDIGSLFALKTHFCMVTAPECNVLIDAEGRLFACDAMPESMRYGDVKNGIDPAVWDRVASPCPVRPECGQCVFLPECTEFDRCPNRTSRDACRRQANRKLESSLRAFYADHMERVRRKNEEKARQEADAAEREEKENVPD